MERGQAVFVGQVSLAVWIDPKALACRTGRTYRRSLFVGSPSSARPVDHWSPVFVGLYFLRSLSLFLRSFAGPAFAGLFDPAAGPAYLACPFSGLFCLSDPDFFGPAVFAAAPAFRGLQGAFW